MEDADRQPSHSDGENRILLGNIYIFHAFDVGEDINLAKIQQMRAINVLPLKLPKYFKNYHMPIAIELPHPHDSARCISCKIHNFGAISLTYKIPFNDTLENIRKNFNTIYNQYLEQSAIDAKSIYKKIKPFISQSHFFQTTSSYAVLQVHTGQKNISSVMLKEKLGHVITSALRFETKALSENQKNEIMDSAIGYFRGDLVIIDTEVSFVYDNEYEEILDFFEFANIQQLELQYFDRLLDQKLNTIYESEIHKVPWAAYLPFVSMFKTDPIIGLGKLKVDISVITERLEGSIKLAGEPYFSELYELIKEKLSIKSWQVSIERKLSIVHNIQTTYQGKIDIIREDMLSVLIIILIFIELIVGVLSYLK